jgi:ATP-dependent protease Clp ATPase subunit
MPDRPVLVVVSGPMGSGKTMLAATFPRSASITLAEDAWRLQAPKRLNAERDREG